MKNGLKKAICTLLATTAVAGAMSLTAACKGKKDDNKPTVCTEHVDADSNGVCDVCGENVTVTTPDKPDTPSTPENPGGGSKRPLPRINGLLA